MRTQLYWVDAKWREDEGCRAEAIEVEPYKLVLHAAAQALARVRYGMHGSLPYTRGMGSQPHTT